MRPSEHPNAAQLYLRLILFRRYLRSIRNPNFYFITHKVVIFGGLCVAVSLVLAFVFSPLFLLVTVSLLATTYAAYCDANTYDMARRQAHREARAYFLDALERYHENLTESCKNLGISCPFQKSEALVHRNPPGVTWFTAYGIYHLPFTDQTQLVKNSNLMATELALGTASFALDQMQDGGLVDSGFADFLDGSDMIPLFGLGVKVVKLGAKGVRFIGSIKAEKEAREKVLGILDGQDLADLDFQNSGLFALWSEVGNAGLSGVFSKKHHIELRGQTVQFEMFGRGQDFVNLCHRYQVRLEDTSFWAATADFRGHAKRVKLEEDLSADEWGMASVISAPFPKPNTPLPRNLVWGLRTRASLAFAICSLSLLLPWVLLGHHIEKLFVREQAQPVLLTQTDLPPSKSASAEPQSDSKPVLEPQRQEPLWAGDSQWMAEEAEIGYEDMSHDLEEAEGSLDSWCQELFEGMVVCEDVETQLTVVRFPSSSAKNITPERSFCSKIKLDGFHVARDGVDNKVSFLWTLQDWVPFFLARDGESQCEDHNGLRVKRHFHSAFRVKDGELVAVELSNEEAATLSPEYALRHDQLAIEPELASVTEFKPDSNTAWSLRQRRINALHFLQNLQQLVEEIEIASEHFPHERSRLLLDAAETAERAGNYEMARHIYEDLLDPNHRLGTQRRIWFYATAPPPFQRLFLAGKLIKENKTQLGELGTLARAEILLHGNLVEKAKNSLIQSEYKDKVSIQEMVLRIDSSPEPLSEPRPLESALRHKVPIEWASKVPNGDFGADERALAIELRAISLRNQKDYMNALVWYSAAIAYTELESLRNTFRLGIGKTLEQMGDWESAIQLYEAIISVNNPDALVLNRLAWLYLTNSEHLNVSRGITLAQRAASLTNESNPSILDTVGEGYLKQGDRALAMEMFAKALALEPRNTYYSRRVSE